MTSSPPRPPFDPEQVPLGQSPYGHLPAVDPVHLHASWLRSRFAQTPVWQPEVFEDVRMNTPSAVRDASVLIPLIPRPQGMQLLLTRRTAHLLVHPGQISFPGGSRDAGDRNAIHTALREAEEEIGLQAQWVEPLGSMPTYTTITGYAVTPVVGIVDPQASLQAQASEVDEVFEVPLAFLMNPAHHELRTWDSQTGLIASSSVPNTARRSFYAMPWTALDGRRYFIWGATAAMIRNLYRLLIA